MSERPVLSVLCFLFTAFVAIGWTEENPVSIKVTPAAYSSRPRQTVTAHVIVTIEKDSDNRSYELSWESDSSCMSSASTRSLDTNSPRKMQHYIELDCGNYIIKLTVNRSDGKKLQAIQRVQDIGLGEGTR